MGFGWATKVPKRASDLHGIDSDGRVWSALKNRGETLQVSWSARVADTKPFLRPANHLDEIEEKGDNQDLGRGGGGGGGNSRNSWT